MASPAMNPFYKNLALWIVIGLLLVALFNLFQTSSTRGPQSTLAFSDFVSEVNRGQVTDVTIQGNNITGHFADGRAFSRIHVVGIDGLVGGHGVRSLVDRALDDDPLRLRFSDRPAAVARQVRVGSRGR